MPPGGIHRLCCLIALALAIGRPVAASDVLLAHGHFYTGDPQMPWAEALVVRGSRIEAIGTDKAMSRWRHGKGQMVDLHGKTVIPGIVDSHIHLLFGAYALHALHLTTPEASITVNKADELVARLKAYAEAHPDDAVIFARADFSAAPPSTPTSELLDRAVADRPVVIQNC